MLLCAQTKQAQCTYSVYIANEDNGECRPARVWSEWDGSIVAEQFVSM